MTSYIVNSVSSLRTSFACLYCALLVCVSASATAAETEHEVPRESTQDIHTRAEWKAAIGKGRCLLFVEGDWNILVAAFKEPHARFANWCVAKTNIRPLRIRIDPNDIENDAFHICDELWKANNISSGGLKTLGGAGRLVWMENGKVVDYAWCWEVMDKENPASIELLKQRTLKAFP